MTLPDLHVLGLVWLGAFLGIPIGVRILAHSDSRPLKVALGGFLILYGTYALVMPRLPYIGRGGRPADGAIGFVGGLLGGIGGYSGVLPTIWTQLPGWSKETARAAYQPYIPVRQVLAVLLVASGATLVL